MDPKLQKLTQWPGYAFGDDGTVWSWQRMGKRGIDETRPPRQRKIHLRSKYLFVSLRRDGQNYQIDVHVLICEAFHGPRPVGDYEASHINGVKTDNRAENLIWETKSANRARRLDHDGGDHGWRNSRALLNKEQVAEVRRLLNETNLTHKEIGEKFGVSRLFITKIENGHRYDQKLPDD